MPACRPYGEEDVPMPVGSRLRPALLKRPFIWSDNCVIIVWPPKTLGPPSPYGMDADSGNTA